MVILKYINRLGKYEYQQGLTSIKVHTEVPTRGRAHPEIFYQEPFLLHSAKQMFFKHMYFHTMSPTSWVRMKPYTARIPIHFLEPVCFDV